MPGDKLDAARLQQDIKTIKAFIEEVEPYGGKMPELTWAVGRLETAVNTGVDLASAADDARLEQGKFRCPPVHSQYAPVLSS